MAKETNSRGWTSVDTAAWILGLGAVAVVVMAYRQQPVVAATLSLLILVATWLSAIDFATHRLPNKIVAALSAAVVVGAVVGGLAEQDLSRSGRAIAFGLVASILFLVLNLMGGIGMGDVKYAFPLVTSLAWFGWQAIATATMVTAVTGAVVAAAAMVMGRGPKHRLAYGPFMSVGLVAGLLRVAPW